MLVFAALSLRPALAQPSAKEAVATPIRYSRDVPHSVLRLMPRRAKSLFWGTFMPKKGSGLMAIHLFHPDEPDIRENNWRLNFVLDVFETSPHLRRINRVPVSYSPSIEGIGPVFDVQLFWLRSAERTQPVVRLRCFDPHGFAGSIGDDVVIVFPQGWKGKTVVQNWFWGSSGGPDPHTSSWQYNMMVVDAKSQLQINAQRFGGGSAPGTGGLFHWNGDKFVAK